MDLAALLESLEGLPESIDPRTLFTERDGKFELTGITGIKTQADIDRLDKSLKAERLLHSTTKGKVTAFGDHTPESITGLVDKLAELETTLALSGDKPDQKAIDELVERLMPARLRPVERERDTAVTRVSELEKLVLELTGEKHGRIIGDTVMGDIVVGEAKSGDKRIPVVDGAAADMKLYAESIMEIGEDGTPRTRDNVGVTPGLTWREHLTDVQAQGLRPHWFHGNRSADAKGGGGGGDQGVNPFDKETFNLTKASQLIKNDPDRAVRFAKAAKRTELLPPDLRS